MNNLDVFFQEILLRFLVFWHPKKLMACFLVVLVLKYLVKHFGGKYIELRMKIKRSATDRAHVHSKKNNMYVYLHLRKLHLYFFTKNYVESSLF